MQGTTRAEEIKVMGLDQLIQMALEQSPQLGEADQDIQVAKSELDQANAAKWAQLDALVTIGPAQDAKRPIVPVSSRTNTGSIVNQDIGRVNIFAALEFSIIQPLYTFGQISNRQDAAAFGLEVQKSSKKQKTNEVVLNVKELYYAYIVASQGKGAAKDADAFIQDAKDRVERLINAGARNADASDLYRLDSYQAEIKQFKAKAESGSNLAYLALQKAVGYPAGQNFKLDATELPHGTDLTGSEEMYIQHALSDRPEIEQLKKAIAARKSLADAAKSDLYPAIFAQAGGALAVAPGRQHLANSYFNDQFNRADVGAAAKGALHADLGVGTGKVDKARAEYEKTISQKASAERKIPVEVAKYYQDALEARASYEAYQKSAVAARKWIVSSFSSFDLGLGTAKDMLDAIQKYGANQGEYLSSLYKYHVSIARLTYAIGKSQSGEL